MYFIVSGTLAYFFGYSEKIPKLCSAGRWMCEPVLWRLGNREIARFRLGTTQLRAILETPISIQ